ncbi:hypothetical protein PILCRDRAFT_17485 [Piloderma croceum F 1598]|uniref:Uncharacterized protein n=1 Tax=Piloderma croceum (strain F 1598) TaxID=765440 RepID=A0A0C3ESD2_PILCF|nr:hypothetical protein PILCRDRAFT_17485 [Piloderma croceum F 1598]
MAVYFYRIMQLLHKYHSFVFVIITTYPDIRALPACHLGSATPILPAAVDKPLKATPSSSLSVPVSGEAGITSGINSQANLRHAYPTRICLLSDRGVRKHEDG